MLVLGSGGREHAIVWKLAKSVSVGKIFVCPGNGGTATMKVLNRPTNFIENISLRSNQEILSFAQNNKIGSSDAVEFSLHTLLFSRSKILSYSLFLS